MKISLDTLSAPPATPEPATLAAPRLEFRDALHRCTNSHRGDELGESGSRDLGRPDLHGADPDAVWVGPNDRQPVCAPPPEQTPANAPADAIVHGIVQSVAVATDVHRRRVILLRVSIPGRGDVRIRVRRGTSGVEVRLSTSDAELRKELRGRRHELAARAREAGAPLSRIEVP